MQFRHLVKRLNWVIGFAIQIHSVGNSLLSKTQKEMFSLPLALSFTRIMIIMCGSGSETKTRNQNDASCHQNSECVCMNPLARFPNCQASGLGSLTSDPPAPKSVETRSCDFSQSLFDIGTLVDPCPPFLEPCPQSIGFYGLPYPPSWYQWHLLASPSTWSSQISRCPLPHPQMTTVINFNIVIQ